MQILDLPRAQRDDFLNRHVLTPEQRKIVLDRVAASEATGDLLDEPIEEAAVARDAVKAAEKAADVAAMNGALKARDGSAKYRIIERIGDGGMGTVYKVEEIEMQRVVALKVINLGMNSRPIIARFDAERQAMALMKHPNVAAIYDAGILSDGRPFFAMEFVPGHPITKFADDRKLDINTRLRLFQQVCDGLQHAHQKGIIHRDIKSANVLAYMDADTPRVKVIDFGIAKALGLKLTKMTINTQFEKGVIGTPAYMSPEQAGGDLDIDTRSDVYSLGVLLYELLAGAAPFDLEKEKADAVIRTIREKDPPRPSTRLSTLGPLAADVANRRGQELKALLARLGGELGWIPLKALKKLPKERYESPAQFSRDIGNYLAGKALIAGPDSVAYRARKFLRRNRGPFAAAAIIVALLIGGIVGTSIGFVKARRQTAATKVERDRAIAAKEFLKHVITSVDPKKAKHEITAADVLAEAANHVGNAFADDEATRAELQAAIGEAYLNLELYARAEPPLKAAYDGMLQREGPDSPEVLQVARSLARVDGKLYHRDEAERLRRAIFASLQKSLGPTDRKLLNAEVAVAKALQAENKLDDAQQIFDKVYQTRLQVFGPNDRDTLRSLADQVSLLDERGRYSEAEKLANEVFARRKSALSEDDEDTRDSMATLAFLAAVQRRNVEALGLYNDIYDYNLKRFGARDPRTLSSETDVAIQVKNLKRLPQAETIYHHALTVGREVMGDLDPEVLRATGNFIVLLMEQEKYPEAERLSREHLPQVESVYGKEHEFYTDELHNLAWTLEHEKNYTEAESLYKQAISILEQHSGPAHPSTLSTMSNYAGFLSNRHRWQESADLYHTVLLRDASRNRALERAQWLLECSAALLELDPSNLPEAEKNLTEALKLRSDLIPPDEQAVTEARQLLMNVLAREGKMRISAHSPDTEPSPL